MHPAAITLLSPEGKISRYLYGIEYPTKDLKLGLLEASEGKIGTTLDKIILYCYHYDPYKNTYTIFATNIMRLGGIFTIIFLGITLVGYWKKDKNLFDKDNLNVR
jgi:protein SCO1/2